MKFIDEANIKVYAGKGGNGAITFRREAHVDKGGPDGGDGGDGGSVYFQPNSGLNTLINIKYKNIIRAEDGENGRRKNQYGAAGENLIIQVPYGTLVYEGEFLRHDVVEDKLYLIAKGGRGGRGNVKFKNSKNKAPQLNENGFLGEEKILHIELQVLADVGLVGLPSAGKSTLLSVLSNSKPKIGDYDFTTLTPQLGFVEIDKKSFVVADLPGLIQGASEGKGLGIQFLKHIERCRVIAHIIDFGNPNKNPIESYEQILAELNEYDPLLLQRKQLIIANKKDLEIFEDNLTKFKNKYPDFEVIEISAINRENITLLKQRLMQLVETSQQFFKKESQNEITIQFEEDFKIVRMDQKSFEITGKKINELVQRIPLSTNENMIRFNYKLKNLGVWDALITKGVKNGDVVKVGPLELEWNDKMNLY